MDANLLIRPEDWIRQTVSRVGDANNDASIGGVIWYTGPNGTVATIKVATTTNDITFKFGASSAAAASSATLGLCPTTCPSGTTAASLSTIDMSSACVSTIYKLMRRINMSKYFKFVPKDLLPTDITEISAGNGIFLPANTAHLLSTTTGEVLTVDTSLKGREYFWAGLTLGGDPTALPNSDVNVLHEILQVKYGAKFATNAGSISLYSCDDDAGTATLIEEKAIAVASATSTLASYFDQATEPNKNVKGRRFVARLSGGSSTTAAGLLRCSIQILSRSARFGPQIRKDKMWSALQS